MPKVLAVVLLPPVTATQHAVGSSDLPTLQPLSLTSAHSGAPPQLMPQLSLTHPAGPTAKASIVSSLLLAHS